MNISKIKNNEKSYFNFFCAFIGLSCFFIILYSAATEPLSYDEAYTYVKYVRPFTLEHLRDYLTPGTSLVANNHLLNTVLIKIINVITGKHYNEFVMRMPSLFFYSIYLILSYIYCKNIRGRYLLFSLLVLSFEINIYFYRARGYSMAICLVLLSLFLYNLWLDSGHKRNFLLTSSLALALLACYANSISLIYMGSLLIIVLLKLINNEKLLNYLKKQFIFLLFLLAGLVYITIFHFRITEKGKPIPTIEDGFLFKTFEGFIRMYIPKSTLSFIVAIVIAVLIAGLSIIFYKKLLHSRFVLMCYICLFFLFILTIAYNVGILKIRVLIPFVPLLLFAIFELFSWFPDISKHKLYRFRLIKYLKNKSRIIACVISSLLIVLLISNFVFKVIKSEKNTQKPDIRDVCYQAFYDKNPSNEQLLSFVSDWPKKFYQQKILYYYDYDINETPIAISNYIEAANDYYSNKEYELARDNYIKARDAINDSGLNEDVKKELKDSFHPHLERSEQIIESVESHLARAKCLEYELQFKEALKELEAALEIYPNHEGAIKKYSDIKSLNFLE